MEWKNISIFIGIIILLYFGVIFLSEDYNEKFDYEEEIEDQFSNIIKLHWRNMPLKYSIVTPEDCHGIPFKNLNLSFDIIKNKTNGLISFEQTQVGGDIEIICIKKDKVLKFKDSITKCKNVSFDYPKTRINPYGESILDSETQLFVSTRTAFRNEFMAVYEVCYVDRSDMGIYEGAIIFDTLGEARPLIQNNLLIKSTIYLYDENNRWIDCQKFPTREMHELLHSFGLDHSKEIDTVDLGYESSYYGLNVYQIEEAKDIMFPYLNCNYQKEVDKKYFDCLKYIYSNGGAGGNCSNIKFLNLEYECENGLYETVDGGYCCPEPNMNIDDEGYCY